MCMALLNLKLSIHNHLTNLWVSMVNFEFDLLINICTYYLALIITTCIRPSSQYKEKKTHTKFRLDTLYELTVEESTILVSLIALLASRGNFCSSPSKSISSTTSKDLGLPPRACGATPIRLLKSLEKKEKKMCDEI